MSQHFQQSGPRRGRGGEDARGRSGRFGHDRGGGLGANPTVPPGPTGFGSNLGGGFGHDRGSHVNHRGGGLGAWNSPLLHLGGGSRGDFGGGSGDLRGPSNHPSHFGGGGRGGRGGPWNHHPGDLGRGRDINHSNTVPRSFPDLHQANQTSYKEVGSSSSSSHNLEKKSNSSDISEQFRELSIQSNNSSSSKFALRPNFGSKGRRCEVTSNHFLITLSPSLRYIHHYNVNILPEIKTKRLNRVVMDELVKSYKESYLGNMLLAYDGQSSFYTAGSLPFTSKEFEVTVPNEGGVKKQYVVAISLVSVIDLQKLREFLAGNHDGSVQEAIQAFDVVLRQTPMLKFVPVKRSFHFSDRTAIIDGGLEAWSGFFQSARLIQNGLSLNIDISAAVFVQNLKVTDFVKEILNYKNLSYTKPLSDVERLKVKGALKGLKVEVKHRKNGRRNYTVSGLTKEPTKELTFPIGDNGEMKHVVQYFQEKYGCNLKYTSLPCLQVGNNKAILLPMEVCTIIGGQRYTKRLNKKQTADMVQLNNQKPRDRAAEILEMVYQNDYLKDEYAKEFGINITETPAYVQARILPSPQLSYHDSDTPFQPKFGQWNLVNKKLFEGGTVSSWSCLNFAVSDTLARRFCEKLASLCNAHGMNFNPRPVLPPYGARAEQVERDLETLQKDARARLKGKELDLLIVILPDNNGSLYGDVKRICETKLGLVSQCVLAETAQLGRTQALANIVLKINAKVGGINVVLKDPLPMVSDRPTIIFGADVTHPSPGEDLSPSIAAVVASQNWPNVTTYVPKFSAQAGREEIIQDLGRMIKEHFQSFVENNNQRRPERIIFYRDGVSEGQFSQVLEEELKAIQKAWLDEFNGSVVPPITFVVVQKRHHTKLFPVKPEDKSGNITAGTVVDSDICHPSQFDFYLGSHAGIKGTSRPAHYHVLWDDNKFTADQLQTLTNNLCYIYARCTRSVSYVSPAYYAHLAAFRARFYFGDDSFSDESSVGGRTRQATVTPVKQLPPLCDNLKNLPFYC